MKLILRTSILSALLGATILAQPAAQDAWALFRRRDYKAALEQMQKDVKSFPESAALHDGLGWCHYFLGAYDEAKASFERALERDPTYKWSRQGLEAVAAARKAPLEQADALLAAGRYLDARALYQKIAAGGTAVEPVALADAQVGDGWCAYYLGRYDEAVKAFQRALKLRSDLASAARGIGYCRYAQGDWSDALVALQISFKSEPEHYEGRLTAGWCFYWKNDFANARKEFERATAAAREPWGAELGSGWCDFKQAKESDALAHFQRAVELSASAFTTELRALVDARQGWWPLYRAAGWSALRARNDSAALEYFSTARNLLTGDADTLRGLAFAYFRLGEYDRAIAIAELAGPTAAALPPVAFPTTLSDGKSAPIAMDLQSLTGWAYYRSGQYDKAFERFHAVRAAHQEWVDAICGEGWVLFAKGDVAAAERAFNDARMLLPGYSDAESGKKAVDQYNSADFDAAWKLFWAGEYERAIEAFEHLKSKSDARISGDSQDKRPLIQASIGWAQARKGDGAAAVRSFEEAAKSAPEIGLTFKGWGWLLMQRSQWIEASEKLERAVACHDLQNDAESHAMLGWSRYRNAQHERALAAFEHAKALDANSAYALSGLAAVYIAQHKPIEARLELERAVRLDPSLEDADWLADELARNDEFARLYSPLGWAWYSKGDYTRAEADFRRAVEKDPLEPTAKRGLALALIQRGKLDEGKELMGKYVATLPKKESPWGAASDVLSEYGWTLYALGDFAAAQKVFKQLAELHTGEKQQYADPYDGLGWCLARLNKPKEARDAFLRAVAIQPRYESSLKGLESLVGRE